MAKNYEQVVVLLSGGLDSTTVLVEMINKYGNENVHAISFNYGQRHIKELKAATLTAHFYNVEQTILNLEIFNQMKSISTLMAGAINDVPKGHYNAATMKSTVVPARNLIMASIVLSYAIEHHIGNIALGVHAGDHAIYPDCRPAFIDALRSIGRTVDDDVIHIITPFLFNTKNDIVKRGLELGVDYTYTWTCYAGNDLPCGKCGSCVERAEAFAYNNIPDPLMVMVEAVNNGLNDKEVR